MLTILPRKTGNKGQSGKEVYGNRAGQKDGAME
jgi:hypothetical protein